MERVESCFVPLVARWTTNSVDDKQKRQRNGKINKGTVPLQPVASCQFSVYLVQFPGDRSVRFGWQLKRYRGACNLLIISRSKGDSRHVTL